MENQSSMPISKRSSVGLGSMFFVLKALESESKHVALAIVSLVIMAAIYIIADGIKNRRQNVDKKQDN